MAPPPMTWDQLAASAKAGELFLDPATERDILAACAQLEAELTRAATDLQEGLKIMPWGTLPTADHFTGLFQTKIFQGPESVIGRLTELVREAQKMKAVFTRSFHNYRTTDTATRDRLTQLGKQVN